MKKFIKNFFKASVQKKRAYYLRHLFLFRALRFAGSMHWHLLDWPESKSQIPFTQWNGLFFIIFFKKILAFKFFWKILCIWFLVHFFQKMTPKTENGCHDFYQPKNRARFCTFSDVNSELSFFFVLNSINEKIKVRFSVWMVCDMVA